MKTLNKVTALTEDAQSGLVELFMEGPPTDKDVHEYAEMKGIDPSDLEEQVYALMHSLLKGVGKHNHVPDSKFDKKELADGIKVELEHTDNAYVAKMIAKDHLAECPDYYTRLRKMEKDCEEKAFVETAAPNKLERYNVPQSFKKIELDKTFKMSEAMYGANDLQDLVKLAKFVRSMNISSVANHVADDISKNRKGEYSNAYELLEDVRLLYGITINVLEAQGFSVIKDLQISLKDFK